MSCFKFFDLSVKVFCCMMGEVQGVHLGRLHLQKRFLGIEGVEVFKMG